MVTKVIHLEAVAIAIASGNRSDGMRCSRSIPYPACHLILDRRVGQRARAAGGMQIGSVRKRRKLCYHL